MTSGRVRLVAGLLGIAAVLALVWTVVEARRQRRTVEETLRAQALVLASSLGPGLAAASHAARELDELVLWKLLDNARLFAELSADGELDPDRLAELADANGLDTVVFLDPNGQTLVSVGEPISDTQPPELTDILTGRAVEVVLGSTRETDLDQISVAVAAPDGGAVLVRIHASTARTFARRLGVDNLLTSLVGTGGVLFLRYREEPEETQVEASWDGEPAPDHFTSPEEVYTFRGRKIFEVTLPVESPAGSKASLQVGLDGAPLAEAASATMRRTLLVGMVLLGLAIAGSTVAVVNRLRSSEREEAAQQLAAAEAARRRSERLAAAGALTAGLAHEVRSPMNAIGLAAQRLERKLEAGDERRQIAQRIREELQRLEGVLREFLELASPVSEEREAVDIAEVASQVVQLLAEEAEAEGVRLEPVQGSGTCVVDGAAIRRALLNLVRNAIQASPAKGSVLVRVHETKQTATITVTDEGEGIAAELEGRIFDPFVTGRASGTGLGLALVRRVVEEHQGQVRLANRPHGGAEATIELPRQRRESS